MRASHRKPISAGFDIKLEVGSQTTTIEVTAGTVLIDTETASRSTDMALEQVQELPINFRNPYNVVADMPGVQFRGNLSWIRPFDGSTSTSWSMNGGVIGYNEILIDGAPNTSIGDSGGSSIGYVPTVFVFFHLTCYGWLIFRAASVAQLGAMTVALLHPLQAVDIVSAGRIAWLAAPLVAVQMVQYFARRADFLSFRWVTLEVRAACYAVLLYLVLFRGGLPKSFIYFQF